MKSIPSAVPSTTSRTKRGRARPASKRSRNGGAISMRSMPAAPRRQTPRNGCEVSTEAIHAFGLRREDFHAVIDGMEMDVEADIRAPDLATLDLYCDRVASAVGRLSARAFRDARGGRQRSRASSWPRAAAHQYLARSRRGRGDRPALSAARGPSRRGHRRERSRARFSPIRRWRLPARRPSRGQRRISARRTGSWRAARARACARQGSWRTSIARFSTAWKGAVSRRRANAFARPAIASFWRFCATGLFSGANPLSMSSAPGLPGSRRRCASLAGRTTSCCTRPPARPAAAAGPITTRRSA